MAILKVKDMRKMAEAERKIKLAELRYELLKSNTAGKKGAKNNLKEIRRTIARLLTLENKEDKKNGNMS